MNDILSKVRKKYYTPPSLDPSSPPPNEFRNKSHISLPFNNFTSKFVKPVLGSNNILVHHTSDNSIRRRLVRNKPVVDRGGGGVGVYTIDCAGCDLKYIGQTGRGLDTRIAEHKNSFKYGSAKSATLDHSLSTNHAIDFKNAKLLYRSDNLSKRLIVESCLIKSCPNFNNTQGVCTVDNFSSKLILSSTPSLYHSSIT